MIYIQEELEHCPECHRFMVILGGSEEGNEVTAFRVCAECGFHQERKAQFASEMDLENLVHLVESAF